MGQYSKIFTALSAGALCLLSYPGIFSRLSNEGKQGPALFIFHALPESKEVFQCLYFYNFAERGPLTKLVPEPVFMPGYLSASAWTLFFSAKIPTL